MNKNMAKNQIKLTKFRQKAYNFKIIPHTADLRLRISGDTLKELFQAAAAGMASIIKKEACAHGEMPVKRRLSLNSADRTALLIDFLSEILTRTQTEKVVFCNVDFKKLSETELDGEIKGVKVDEFEEDIKAVTFHEAEVRKNEKGQWETTVIFDI